MLKIPPGRSATKKLRLRKKGVPSATKDGVRRDEFVEVKITCSYASGRKTKIASGNWRS